MPQITFVTADGAEYHVDAAVGTSVMEAAMNNSVPGIAAECGGACACATCHVYMDDAAFAAQPAPDGMEGDMLEFAWEPKATSRLSCQLKVSDDMDGLVLHFPAQQA